MSTSKSWRFKVRSYSSWISMKRRCRDPEYSSYENYGAKGVDYCVEWESFNQFLADMGYRPEGMTLERIDRSGNYEPSNCKWATYKEQAFNRRSTITLTIDGVTKCMLDWAKEYNIEPTTIRYRISHGWSDEQAVKVPPHSEEAGRINHARTLARREARAKASYGS